MPVVFGDSIGTQGTAKSSSSSAPSAGGTAKPPKSYRRLVDGIAASEAAASIYKREALQTSFEIAELRNGYRNAMGHVEMMQHEEANFSAHLSRSNLESAAMWNAHEQPLHDQEEAVQTSARLVAALELREEMRSAVNMSLRLECEELDQLHATLRSETAEHGVEHALFTQHMDRAESSASTLAERCNEWDQRVEVLQSKATAERDRDRLMEAEIEAARTQMEATKFELGDIERRCQGSVASWWQDQGSRCHSLAMESEMLQQELEQSRQEHEWHVEESAEWREQAYRSEAGLLQLRRGDVASGIRSICEQCSLYANAVDK